MDWYRSSRFVMDSDPPGFRIVKQPIDDELKWYALFKGSELIKSHHDYQILMAEAEKLA
jgi:hypothetical protein